MGSVTFEQLKHELLDAVNQLYWDTTNGKPLHVLKRRSQTVHFLLEKLEKLKREENA